MAVAARHLTAATLTVYPTSSFPDLLFVRIKWQEKKEKRSLQLDARMKVHYACFFIVTDAIITAARSDGMSQARYLYYYEHIWDMPTHLLLMIMRRDIYQLPTECLSFFFVSVCFLSCFFPLLGKCLLFPSLKRWWCVYSFIVLFFFFFFFVPSVVYLSRPNIYIAMMRNTTVMMIKNTPERSEPKRSC